MSLRLFPPANLATSSCDYEALRVSDPDLGEDKFRRDGRFGEGAPFFEGFRGQCQTGQAQSVRYEDAILSAAGLALDYVSQSPQWPSVRSLLTSWRDP